MTMNASSLPDLLKEVWRTPLQETMGRQFIVPIRRRSGWDDAVAWLEARESAREEWPWPERDA